MTNDLQPMLELWMNLQRAVSCYARERKGQYRQVKPWLCDDPIIQQAWRTLTDPQNIAILEKWLEAEIANRQSSEWAMEAVRQCRERAASK